jgi:outer membrane protein insertion porin family
VVSVSAEFAGLGGSVKYARFSGNAGKYWILGKGWIFSLTAEGGLIKGLQSGGEVRLTDRFYLGEPQIRGFDIRGVGPRVVRKSYLDTNGDGIVDGQNYYCYDSANPTVRTVATASTTCSSGTLLSPDTTSTDKNTWQDDALGGKFYYMSRAELEIPLGSGAKEMGIRPSIFLDAGAVWSVKHPTLQNQPQQASIPIVDTAGHQLYTQLDTADTAADGTCTNVVYSTTTNQTNPNPPACLTSAVNSAQTRSIAPFREFFYGDSWKPRIAVGIGFNWNSPMGPFRIDFAKTLLKQDGDNTKSFTFNVGTQF